MTETELARAVLDAIWAQDTERLYWLAPCRCCCDEHYSENCWARMYGGCRGAPPMSLEELRKLAETSG